MKLLDMLEITENKLHLKVKIKATTGGNKGLQAMTFILG